MTAEAVLKNHNSRIVNYPVPKGEAFIHDNSSESSESIAEWRKVYIHLQAFMMMRKMSGILVKGIKLLVNAVPKCVGFLFYATALPGKVLPDVNTAFTTIGERIRGTITPFKDNIVARALKSIWGILDIPYTIAFAPVGIIRRPLAKIRQSVDRVLGKVFNSPFKILSLFSNLAAGWMYNILNGTILLPTLVIMEIIYSLSPRLMDKYAWLNMCLGTRMYFIGSLVYKNVTKIFLLIPIFGWILWLACLPMGYFLALFSIFLCVCPVENLMPIIAPSAFPETCKPGCMHGKCEFIV